MAADRRIVMYSVAIKGSPLVAEVHEFVPPELKKLTEDSAGGSFTSASYWVGLDKLAFTLKLSGVTRRTISEVGLAFGKLCQIDVKISEVDRSETEYTMHHNMSGEILSVKEEQAIKKQSGSVVTISGECSIYKLTENGEVVYNINHETQEMDLGEGDLLASHRSNIGL